MIDTAFTELVGAALPIQLAPMPGIALPGLVAAVAEAGGVGMLPAALFPPAQLEAVLDELESATHGAVGVGFLVPFLEREAVEVAARRARLVELFYGDPDRGLVEAIHAGGALAGWQVGSLDEALAAERAGCDWVVLQGTEAGGHVRGESRLLPLLAEARERLRTPIVAAGGLATGADLAAVLAAGAAGARFGTRFVAAAESGAHPAYVQALLTAKASDTVLTEAFHVTWPDAPHRVLRSAIAAAEALEGEVAGEMRMGDESVPVPRFSALPPTAATTGRIEAMALYAGESVERVRAIQPAAEIVAAIAAAAERALREATG